MKKEITFQPAYDKRSHNPKEDYGIHGVNMRWVLQGELGAVQFVVYTNWHLPHVEEELDNKTVSSEFPHLFCHPQPADLGYHSPNPIYEGQKPMEHCDLLPGGKCYYDGSGLKAQDLFNVLVEKGGEEVWKQMEERYTQLFGELK